MKNKIEESKKWEPQIHCQGEGQYYGHCNSGYNLIEVITDWNMENEPIKKWLCSKCYVKTAI